MAKQRSSSESLFGLQRFDAYYINGGDLYCIAENKMFRIHRYFFERESKFFKEQLAVPATPGAPRMGASDDSAIILDNVRSADFAKLLWVFYNPKYSLYDATIEDWSTILELAHRWEFAEVKNLAVRELEKLQMPDVDRIVLYHSFAVDETYLIPRYAALCERPELLTVEEGLRLGMETVISLSRVRECMRNSASSGLRSPSPGIGGEELTEIIKDHFGIKPVVAQPTEAEEPKSQQPPLSTQNAEKPDISKLDTSKVDTSKVDTSKVDTSKPDTPKLDDAAAGAGNKTPGGFKLNGTGAKKNKG